MKVLALAVSLLILTGCSPATLKPTHSNSSESIELIKEIKLDVPSIPDKPKASVVTDVNGNEYVGFDSDGLDQLNFIVVTAKANTLALQELENATNAIIKERNATVRLLNIEEKRANVMADQAAAVENRRRHEEQQHSIRQTVYEFLIVLLAIATAL